MKNRPLTAAVALTGLLFSAFLPASTGLAAVDSNLKLSIGITNNNAVLSWFASNAIVYQVQSSSTLITWADVGSPVSGNGAMRSFTNPLSSQGFEFYRVGRVIPVVTATFDTGTGVLTITGDALPNSIAVSRNAAGNILVNGGTVAITGGTPTVANTTLIQAFCGDGNDVAALDESNGALPKANLFGEGGADTLTGGSGADTLTGGPGDDILLGKGGADLLVGGDDSDTATGGDANDIVQLGSGNDRAVWNPGDDTDVIEGADGTDTVQVNGGNGAEIFVATANGTRVRFDRIDPAPFSLDIGTCESLVLNANGGDDSFSATGNLAALITITVDGGTGNDTLLGGNGPDLLIGGDGIDFIDGNQGNDVAFLGAGDDTFQWDPGDGNDTIEGQDGTDLLQFNASNASEILDLSANGSRLRILRNIGNIQMDCNDLERVKCLLLGGTDIVTVNDLSGTDVTEMTLDLSASFTPGTGDGAADGIYLNGRPTIDNIFVNGTNGTASITGFFAPITILGSEPANDKLGIYGMGDDDVIDASGLAATVTSLTLDGGSDDDVLVGSDGADLLFGGDGDDVLIGGPGLDALDGGTGSNVIIQ